MNHSDRYQRFVAALEHGDRRACFAMHEAWRAEGLAVADIYHDLFLPALAHVGAKWESNTLSVVDEHVATGIIRQLVSHHAVSASRDSQSKGSAIVGCVPNEFHDIPGLMFANLLEQDGWDVLFFGQSAPGEDIVAKVRSTEPKLLCLIMKTTSRLDETMSLLRRIREASPGTHIMLGGVNDPAIHRVLSPLVDHFASCPVTGVGAAADLARA